MRHVDDELLIAYADDALAAEERRTVDAHLAECAACCARVEQERALALRADEVLGAVAPAAQPMPPFEDVLRRRTAGAQAARRPWLPLAWAASVLVAVGAGWMANELLLMPEVQVPAQRTLATDAAAVEPASPNVSSAAESQAAGAEPASGVQRARSAAADAAPAQQEDAAERELPAAPPAPQPSPEGAAAADTEREPAVALQEIVVTGAASAQQKAGAPAEARREDTRSELAAVAYAPADPVLTMELDDSDILWRGAALEGAPLEDAPVLGVADVAIDSVWVAHDSADWRARVLHRLEEGALEVIEWRRSPWQGVVASGTLPDGRRYLLGRRGDALVELRARLTAEELESLLARVRPLQ